MTSSRVPVVTVRCAASCHLMTTTVTTFIESDQCHPVLTDDCSHPAIRSSTTTIIVNLTFRGVVNITSHPLHWPGRRCGYPGTLVPSDLEPLSLCSVGVTVLVPQGLWAGWAWEADGLSPLPGLIIQTNLKCVETEDKKQKWREERKG